MDITYNEYINNPMGKKNGVITNRELLRTFYTNKYNIMMLKEAGKIEYTLYKSSDKFYIHIKVPSEKIKKFYYDVVVEFYTKDSKISVKNNLSDYNVKFYSNDPAFVYTFAHAFIDNKIFIEDLKPRMSKESIKKVAKIKNPKNESGYVKSLYFTYLYMKGHGLFSKTLYEEALKYDKNMLMSNIMNASEKVDLRQKAQEELNKKNKNDNKKKLEKTAGISSSNNSIKLTKMSNISNTKKVGTKVSGISKVAKSSRISKRK